MNEQAFQDLYEEFVNTGYRGSRADFKELLSSNPDAFNDGFQSFVETGYNGTQDDFAILIGVTNPVKKKDSSQQEGGESNLEDGSSAFQEFDAETFFANYDPNKITPQDRRVDGYEDPMRNLGMYPDKETLERAQGQAYADMQYTQDLARQEQAEDEPFLQAQKNTERLAEQEKKDLEQAQMLGIQASEEFKQDISKIDGNLIDQEEEKVVPFLRDNFGKYGFVFEETGIGDAMIVTSPDGSNSIEIDLDPFTSKTEIIESKKLKNFIKNNLTQTPDAPIADEITQALRAKNLRDVARTNPDGTLSTVLMASGEVDGKFIAYPTLFPKDPDAYTSNPIGWEELSGMDAINRAYDRGEVFEFETAEEAEKFAAGSWKEIGTHDAEAKAFYSERGLDYTREKALQDEYEDVKNMLEFIEGAPRLQEDVPPDQVAGTSQLYINGRLRRDIDEVEKELTQRYDDIKDAYLNDESELAREDFDLYLQDKFSKSAGNAVRVNNVAKQVKDEIDKVSLLEFGVLPNDLNTVTPKDENEAAYIKQIQQRYVDALASSEKAADVYERSKLYYTLKHDKAAQGEYAENLDGFLSEWKNGLSRGKAGDVILMASMFPELLGGYDLDDPESTRKAAASIVTYLQDRSNTKSRVLYRWQKANGFDESWDVIADNPMEWATTLAGQSLSMMLPYGSKIIASSTAAGTGTGAAIGSVVPGAGTAAGAATGFTWGFRTGFAATSVAMEYTNAVIDAISNQGYDINDPDSVAAALADESVWAEGKERGLKRGIPIAIVDLITAKLAGNVFRTGSLASAPARVSALTAERMIVDPIGEGVGEILAQVNVGDELDWKEVVAEMGGGIGNNTSNMAINLALETRAKNDLELATNFTNINFMATELSSNSKISAWANNMERLGKIDAQTNQQIQENVGYRKTAQELLSTGRFTKRFRGKNALALEQRVMTLLAAKNELSSSTNRKEIFAPKIKEINAELSEILTTKELRNKQDETILAGTGVLSVEEQAAPSDLRQGRKSYKIRKGLRGKLGRFTEVSKDEFLEYINGLSAAELSRVSLSIDNDDEVSQFVANKLVEARVTPVQEKLKVDSEGTLVVDQGEQVQTTPTTETTTEETPIEATDVSEIYGSDVVTHKTRSKEAIESWVNGGQIVGRNENVDEFVEGVPEQETGFNLDRSNRQVPNFQTGKVFGDKVSDIEGGYVIVSKPGTINNDTDFQPSDNFVNRETIEESGGIVIPKPGTPARDINNYDIYKVVDGKMVKQDINQFRKGQETSEQIQQQTAEDGVSSKTLETEQAVMDNDAAAQEVSDLEASLQATELNTKPKVDFKLESNNENNSDNVGPDEADITTEINEIESPNVDATVETEEVSQKIDVNELNQRTDNPLKVTKLEVIKGVPTIFSITDQLTTGNVVNPETNTTIENLKGAIGFNGTVGNDQAAWANVTEKEAQGIIFKAEQVYENNKELFDEYWAKNPEMNGLVPMNIVKMGEQAMISNEAVFRVLLDNIKTLPAKNRRQAVPVLKQEIKKKVDFYKSKQNPPKELGEFEQLAAAVRKLKPKTLDDVLTNEFVQTLPLPVRSHLMRLITTGKANTPNQPSKKVTKVGKGSKAVPKVLMEGVETETSKINIGAITDVITDPQLRNVPIGNVVSVVGVDVLNPGIVETTHPNYKYGVRGKSIGILESPQPMEKVYPKAYQKIFAKLIEKEKSSTPESKPTSVKTIRAQQTGVGIGIPSFDYVGVIVNESPSNVDKLNTFMNIAFPGVVINSDTETFNNVLESDNVRVYLKGDEVVYGVTVDGDIYINPEVHNSESSLFNTSIHEMGHVWTDYLQTTEQGKKIYAKGAELVQQTETFKEQLKRFNGDVDKATNEAMAILIGNKGETIANASLKSKFKEWLLGMWNYIKQQFKMSTDLTEEEIQDMTLDQFLGTALADIFAGQEIKMTDKQMKMLKNPEAAFSTGLSMDSIIEQGRRQGFSDESIRVVLKNRGFKAKDINNAMVVNIDLMTPMPREFGNVEGGAVVGQRLFNEVRDGVNAFSIEGPRGGRGRQGVRTKSFAEIRQKGLDLLRENEIFKVQPEQTQLELLNAFDRAIGIRSNANVRREIAEIRNKLRQRRISEKNITEAQRRMRMIIRRMLPKSKNYSNRAVNKLLKVVNETNPKNFDGKMSEVLTEVEKQRGILKNQLIDKISELVRKKSKTRKTASGKRRSSGLDAAGQQYFNEVNKVLKAVKNQNVEALEELSNTVTPDIMSAIENKINQNKPLTTKEKQLIDRRLALDTFADVLSMELEQVEELFQDVKNTRAESIANLNNRREIRRQMIEEQKQKFQEQIKNDYSQLYDENGNPLNKNQLRNRKQLIRKAFQEGGLWSGMTEFLKTLDPKQDGQLTPNSVENYLRNKIAHLGTVTRLLDKNTEGMFTETFYNRLNDFDENTLQGVRRTENKMNAMAESTHNKTWEKWKYSLGNDTMEMPGVKNTKTGATYTETLNRDQAMRLYALSKNEVQRAKLEKQGVDIEAIKNFIGKENVELVDQAVDFLSNEYFEQTNAVYSQVNDVNLGYVENYFPTRTISNSDITNDMIGQGQFDKIFTAEYSPALKERTDMTNDVEIGLSFSEVMEEHVKSMEKYKAYAVGVKEMNEILKDEQIQNLLDESGLSLLFKQNLNFAINPDSGPGVSNDVVSKIQTRFTGFALALKLIQIPKQMSSFVLAFKDYSATKENNNIPGYDILMFAYDYFKVLARLRTEMRETKEISATFDARIKKGLEGDIFGLESGGRTFKRSRADQSKRGRLKRGTDRAAGFTTVAGDILGVLGYKAVYNRAIANGMNKADALRLLNKYNTTQQTRRATEKAPIQQSTDTFNRYFTMFGSSLFLMMNNVMQSGKNITMNILRGTPGKIKKADLRKFVLNYSVANVAFTAVSYAPALLHGKDDERDRAYKALRDAALGLNLFYQIPILGAGIEQLVATIEGDRKPISEGVNPVTSLLRKINKTYKEIEDSGELYRVLIPLFELYKGMQLDAPIALVKLLSGDTSEDNVYDAIGVTPSYRPGYGQKKKKSSGTTKKKTSKSDLKLIDEDLYNELYGKGSPTYETKQELRQMRKELKEDLFK